MPRWGANARSGQPASGQRVARVLSVALPLTALALAGCEDASPIHLDPLNIGGRAGAGPEISYGALMRIGAAAHAGGDLGNAVAMYRRAAVLNSSDPAPLVAAGTILLEMGQANEAIVSLNGALERAPHDPEALRALARAYLKTGRPELAAQPLAVAYQDTPDDPKLLQLIGVADDYAGSHAEAQARYRRGLELRPGDPALVLNLALSLALTEQFGEAVQLLAPLAMAPTASARDRQTLALIYGLQGDRRAAERVARRDLDAASVAHNLTFYDTLRRLPPEARSRAILNASAG